MPSRLSFLLTLLAFTVACSSSSGGGGAPDGSDIVMTGSVEITGDKTASGSFSTAHYTFQASCAAYASEGSGPDDQGPEGMFEIPGPIFNVPLTPSRDIYASTMRISADVYAGPGTYRNNRDTTEIEGQIILEEIPDGPAYFVQDGPAMVTIMADGSGSLTFANLPEDTDGDTSISGSVTWTCSEE